MDNKEEVYEYDFSEKILSEKEAKAVSKILREFLESYASSKDKISVEEWLIQEFQKQLPDKSFEEIKEMSAEIIESLRVTEDMKESQEKALATGISNESWLASKILEGTSQMSLQDRVKYLQGLDDAVKNSNVEMIKTITTKGSGYINPSMNPNLDGFIAEQHHVNSFNMNAKAKGSGLRAEVPTKPGKPYTKNGVDVVIKDNSGKIINRYQMKYGKSAEETIKMIKSGDYRNQRLVVPEEQVAAVKEAFPNKTVTSTIGDGNISSNPLTKDKAKELQEKAQSNNYIDVDWNDYKLKDIATGIGKEVIYSGCVGVVAGAGIEIASKVWNGEPIDGEKVIEAAIVTGADQGVKAATTGALKVASEKGILKAIPKGTGTGVFANIAFVAIENMKIIGKIGTGELTLQEGIYEAGKTTASCVAGIAASAKGSAIIGAAIGTVLGPVGTAVGGFVGGTVAYIAGSKVTESVVKGAKKIYEKGVEVVKSIASGIVSVGRSVVSVGRSIVNGIGSFLGFW